MSTSTKQASRLEQMLRQQVIERGLNDARLLTAMRAIPREAFFAEDQQQHAYADRATPIGHEQTISQPYVVALMTHHLQPRSTHRVLEIGTGSGYQTAVLSRLAGDVYSIERIKPLLDDAFDRLGALGVRNVHFRHGDGFAGWPEAAPFDRILFTAAPRAVPKEMLLAQLADDGVCVMPAGEPFEQQLLIVRRIGDSLSSETVCPVSFVEMLPGKSA
jgi:protein-L-isoaspartate(D-aspartate) O-methyltransferase